MDRNRLMAKNFFVSTGFALINFFLGIFEVKIFLARYGDIVNGLVQTGNQALAYLSLIESGICAAFLYHLYRPLSQEDYMQVSSLYNGFKRAMRRVTVLMLVAAFGICSVMPLVIKDKTLSYSLSFGILSMLSIRYIAPYAISLAPKYMLIAHEKKFLAEIIDGLKLTLVYFLNIIILTLWEPPICILLLMNVMVVFFTCILCLLMMRKEYDGLLRGEAVPDFTPTKMSKDLLAHNISGLAFNSCDNIVLATMSPSLVATTIYSSYNKLISNIISTGQKIIEGANGSIGIKIAKHDSNTYDVFRELISFSQYFSSILAIVVIVCINRFIEIWLGNSYVLGATEVYLFSGGIYAEIVLRAYLTARNAKGLFHESRNFTIIQSVVNIGLSVILVGRWGIAGVLFGTVVGRYCIALPCNYRLVYAEVFPDEVSRWWEQITSPLLIIAISAGINMAMGDFFNGLDPYIDLACRIVASVSVAGIGCGIYQMLTDRWFLISFRRIVNLLKK